MDGQTERAKSVMLAILRKLCGEDTEHWPKLLQEVEFSMNNHVNATTGVSPYQALYSYHPRMAEDAIPEEMPRIVGVRERIKYL